MRISTKEADVILTCLSLVCFLINGLTAAPPERDEQKSLVAENVNRLNYHNLNIGVDGYDFSFETSDGIVRKEKATVKNLGTEDEAISVEGTVSWVGPDGIQYTLNYLADENGFQPEGEHLPVAPET